MSRAHPENKNEYIIIEHWIVSAIKTFDWSWSRSCSIRRFTQTISKIFVFHHDSTFFSASLNETNPLSICPLPVPFLLPLILTNKLYYKKNKLFSCLSDRYNIIQSISVAHKLLWRLHRDTYITRWILLTHFTRF